VKLSEREQNLLLRGLDKASSSAEAEKAAQVLFESLRSRGVSGHDVRAQLVSTQESAKGPSFPSEEWNRKVREDWFRTYGGGPNNPPPGINPNAWKRAWERRDPTPEEAAAEAAEDAFQEWVESEDEPELKKTQPNSQVRTKSHKKATPGQMLTIFVTMLTIGCLTHSWVAGLFIGWFGGVFLIVVWGNRTFRRVLYTLGLIIALAFVIGIASQSAMTRRAVYAPAPVPPVFSQFGDVEASKRSESYGMRVATADEVSAYNEYINKGGDPNQVPVLDRLAVALAKNPNFLLDPANRNVLDELVRPRLEQIRAQATPEVTTIQQNSLADYVPRAVLIKRDPVKPVPRARLVNPPTRL
jgi:hypothetical protein